MENHTPRKLALLGIATSTMALLCLVGAGGFASLSGDGSYAAGVIEPKSFSNFCTERLQLTVSNATSVVAKTTVRVT